MKRSCLALAVLLALTCAWGCKTRLKAPSEVTTPATTPRPPVEGSGAPALTPQETLARQAVQLLHRATDLLNSIRDRPSASAAAPELRAIALQLQDLNRRGVPLGSQASQHYADVAVRLLVQEDVLGPEFQEALRELGKLPQ